MHETALTENQGMTRMEKVINEFETGNGELDYQVSRLLSTLWRLKGQPEEKNSEGIPDSIKKVYSQMNALDEMNGKLAENVKLLSTINNELQSII